MAGHEASVAPPRLGAKPTARVVLGMLAGLLFHALTHNHHSLTTGNYYFD